MGYEVEIRTLKDYDGSKDYCVADYERDYFARGKTIKFRDFFAWESGYTIHFGGLIEFKDSREGRRSR
jgi:hypothetical protein